MKSQVQQVLRTSKAFYWLVGGILGVPLLLALDTAVAKTPEAWPPTVILGCLLAAATAFFRSTKLVLDTDAIYYRSLFVTRHATLAQVKSAKFVVGFSGYQPYQRLVLAVREGANTEEVVINMGLFDRSQIKSWMELLSREIRGHPGDKGR